MEAKPLMRRPDAKVKMGDPLEDALASAGKIDRVYKKYNIKKPRDYSLPSMQFEGEDQS